MKHKMLVALLGLAAGLLVGFVLPSRWVFVKDPVRVSHEEGAAPGQFACPMFCVVMEALPEDGKCPVCGMELTVVTGESALSESDRRMIGLQVEVLGRLPLERSVRVVGEVDYDETRLSRITTRTAGWLQKVWADTTWTAVEKGGKLASIYAPELYQAQREYVDSLQAEGGNFDAFLQQAAERRLRLLGIGDEEIAALRSSRKVHDALILRAPRDGVIVEKNAVEGASVKEGELLYALADLSQVWVQAEVFEQDLVWVRPGQKVHLETAGRPERIVGRVAFIDPAIDRQSRTARVRIEVPNPKAGDGSRLLRIGQRVDATFRARLDEAGRPVTREPATDPLAIPRTAVLSTGKRKVAYVLFTETGGSRDYAVRPGSLPARVLYEMVLVEVGPLATRADKVGEEYYPLLGGEVKEGYAIVTKGNLLLDSQAQLSGKPSLLFPEGSRGTAADPHAGH